MQAEFQQLQKWLDLTNQQFAVLRVISKLEHENTATTPKNIAEQYRQLVPKGIQKTNLFGILKVLLEKELLLKDEHTNYTIRVVGIKQQLEERKQQVEQESKEVQNLLVNVQQFKQRLSNKREIVTSLLEIDDFYKRMSRILKSSEQFFNISRFPAICFTQKVMEGIGRGSYYQVLQERCLMKKELEVNYITQLDISRFYYHCLRLLKNPDVQYVEIDQDVPLFEHREGHKEQDDVPWGVKRVLSWRAWNETGGKGVKIAVLDSGIARHEDLKVKGGTSVISDTYEDFYGHGTQVAGVIAAVLNRKGIVGNAPEAELYAVKITESGTGKLSDAIGGLEWAIENDMDIASMSFGFRAYSQIFKEVAREAYEKGMVLVAASGNDGTEGVLYPAKYSYVIAVGATDRDDERADFSNYGIDLELVAPGDSIKTTDLNNEHHRKDGTSFAAPHVTGVAALIRANYPTLTNSQIREKLRRDVIDLGPDGKDKEYGFGLVQFQFGIEGLEGIEDSYFYEIYNITIDLETSKEEKIFWKNGTGTIDEVDFQPGYYFIRKLIDGEWIEDKYFVDEEQNFILLMEVSLNDSFTREGSLDSDGRAWKNV